MPGRGRGGEIWSSTSQLFDSIDERSIRGQRAGPAGIIIRREWWRSRSERRVRHDKEHITTNEKEQEN
jgi:hypothetical protein